MTEPLRYVRWTPELRRAIMRVRPEFFLWPPAEQARYGLDLPDDDSDRLDQALLQELFGQTYASAAEASAAAAGLPRDQLDRWNETIQPLHGIGEDAFFLNDHIPDGKTLLDFPTMRDLDEATYAAQERFRREDDAAYTGKPYRGDLYLGWARLYLDGRFTYATLSMAAGYIYAELDSAVGDAVKDCIPYTFVPGPDHGKAGTKSWQWDMRRDADGLEAMLDELDRRSMQQVSELFTSLLDQWHGLKRCGVYIFDNPDETAPQDHNVHIVFTDIEALAAVRPDFFVRDCRLIERPVSELNEAMATAKADAIAWVKAQHQQLIGTFDPKVTTLPKKRKVMILNNALKGLE